MRHPASTIVAPLLLALGLSAACRADDPVPKGSDPAAAPTPNRVPLIRFYNTKNFAHVYAYKPDELAEFRKLDHLDEQKVVGLVSTTREPGSVRLWRAIRSDGRYYFYLKAPQRAKNVRVQSMEFEVYVWKNGTDGRTPVFATSWTDGTDVYLDPDKERIKRYSENQKNALGVIRPDFGILFYAYPAPKPE